MRDVMDRLEGWWKNGEAAALATVVGTYSSAPRQPGASMLIGPDGEAVGSVSGGIQPMKRLCESGIPRVLDSTQVFKPGEVFAMCLMRTR